MTKLHKLQSLQRFIARARIVNDQVRHDALLALGGLQDMRELGGLNLIEPALERYHIQVARLGICNAGLTRLEEREDVLRGKWLEEDSGAVTGRLNIEDMDPIEGKWRKQRDEKRGIL